MPAALRLVEHVRGFASLLIERHGTHTHAWMIVVESSDLAPLHALVCGLGKDPPAVLAGLTLPYSNGLIEGVNAKVKLFNDRYGRACFPLLRQRILLS